MSKIGNLLKRYEEEATPFTSEEVVSAWNDRLADLGMEDISVDSAEVTVDGGTKLTLSSGGDTMEIGFIVKDEDGERIPYAVSLGDDSGQGALEIDLSNADVPIVDGGAGAFIDMTNLSWLTDEIASGLFGADSAIQAEPDIEPDDVPVGGEEEEGPEEEPDDGKDDLLGKDDGGEPDKDDDEEERYIGIRKVEGRLKAEMVTKPCKHKILCRRARSAFRNTFENKAKKKEGKKKENHRRASLKSRLR